MIHNVVKSLVIRMDELENSMMELSGDSLYTNSNA